MIFDISDETKQEVLYDLAKTRAPSRTAKNLGYDIRLILQIIEEQDQPSGRIQERNGGEGRPELRQFVVARKKAWTAWDNKNPQIAHARASVEAGTHEMATGRDGDWLIMYLIPRKVVRPLPNYFMPEASL